MKVCDAIPGTLNVVSEENAAINENNRFTERFNFELEIVNRAYFKQYPFGHKIQLQLSQILSSYK